ncbi:hypothetical protein BGW38_006195 [Lunasporangiospora selenospora]|uniref:Anoctamin transmembrane domain-containing protein n=1 Tax=Lunasporangiospora selenospora TaxID=979761 RepID=A0A9P6G1D0_9FUNG|nr:hypothetical protein BGW38_006195 [Lunasporangiospora selenospora]
MLRLSRWAQVSEGWSFSGRVSAVLEVEPTAVAVDAVEGISSRPKVAPDTGLCAFINNWVELRSDAAKICFHTRRPIPGRTDSIGPWIDNLQYLAWFSSLTNASILYLFHGTMPSKGHGIETSVPTDAGEVTRPEFNSGLGLGMLLLGLIASEHFYFLINWTVRNILESIPSTAELTVRKKDYNVKRSWLKRLNEAVGSTFLNSPNPIITVVGSNGDATTLTTDMGQEGEGEKTRSVMSKTSGYSPVGSMDGVVGWRARLQHDLGAEAIRTVFKSL